MFAVECYESNWLKTQTRVVSIEILHAGKGVIVLGRIACIAYLRPIATDVARSVVCMSVCVLVKRICPAKTAELRLRLVAD